MMLPTPPVSTDQVTAAVMACPNSSLPMAVNNWLAPSARLTLAGVTAMLVNVWLTVTATLLVVLRPPRSLIVTVKV